jgi:hypothetical protein
VVDSGNRKVKAMAAKKAKGKKSVARNASPPKHAKVKKKKAVAKAKSKARKKKITAKPTQRSRAPRGRATEAELVGSEKRGLGARSGGQSGDTQGLAADTDVDSESVEQLLEEGQSFEAEVLSGVESAPDPDEDEVHTREVPEDDVPEEYLGKD